MTGDVPAEQKEFIFTLSKEEKDGSFRQMAGTDYSIEVGTTQNTYQTDENGRFKLKANETARFTGLPEGKYKVEEDVEDFGPEYAQKEPVQFREITTAERSVSFIFKNQYNTRYFDLHFYKKNKAEEPLAGAEFMLYRDEMLKNPVQDTPYQTGADGKISIEKLKTGIYYPVETKSPEGYRLPANPVKIEVSQVGKTMKVQVDNREVTSDEPTDQIYIELGEDGELGAADRTNDQVHITIYNSKNFILPATGGAGILMMAAVAGGILLLLLAMWKMIREEEH